MTEWTSVRNFPPRCRAGALDLHLLHHIPPRMRDHTHMAPFPDGTASNTDSRSQDFGGGQFHQAVKGQSGRQLTA